MIGVGNQHLAPSPFSALPPPDPRTAVPPYISGRTSYLRVRLEFLLYPQVIPQFCNTGEFEPRRGLTLASLCPWIAHPVSGLIAATPRRPLQTRFRCGSTALAPLNLLDPLARGPAASMNSPDHSTKGTPSPRHRPRRDGTSRALTACKCRVSGSISFPLRGAFHLSLTVLVHYRSVMVFSLGGWSPQLPTGFPLARGTHVLARSHQPFAYGTVTLFGPPFQVPFGSVRGF